MSITPTNCLADHDGWTESTISVCKACWDALATQLAAAEKQAGLLARELRVVHGEKNALAARVAQLEGKLSDERELCERNYQAMRQIDCERNALSDRVAKLEREREEAVLNSAPTPDCESCADARPRECYSCIEVLVKKAREEGRSEGSTRVAQLEGALEPTTENIDGVAMIIGGLKSTSRRDAVAILAAIRARAGLGGRVDAFASYR